MATMRTFFLQCAVLCYTLLTTTVQAQITPGCLFTMEQLLIQESFVTDFSVVREYVVCENRVWNIGSYDNNNVLVPDSGSQPFPLRPNLHLRCGGTGDRDNGCLIQGGDVQVDGTNFLGVGNELDIENVMMQGFTFTGANRYSVWAVKGGSITFVDCEWKEITNAYAPLYFDYFNPEDRQSILDIAFVGCSFTDNVYYGDGAYPALIIANGDQNHLTIDRSDFTNNDYIFNNTQYERNSYLIESSGDLRLTLNCFTNNQVGVSPAASFGAAVTSDSNYGDAAGNEKCAFLSRFETLQQYENVNPECDDFEVNTRCLSATTSNPSLAPVDAAPTMSPTNITTLSPTNGTNPPSMVPSLQPSSSPSGLTLDPSGMPSSVGSGTPTMIPPSTVPSELPTTMPSLLPSTIPSGKPTTTMPSNLDPSAIPSIATIVVGSSSEPSGAPSTDSPTFAPSAGASSFVPFPSSPPIDKTNPVEDPTSGATTVGVALVATIVAITTTTTMML